LRRVISTQSFFCTPIFRKVWMAARRITKR